MHLSYCVLCGNTGIDIHGNVCSCKANIKSVFEAVSCLDIPEQYRGLKFNSSLLPQWLSESCGKYMQTVYDKILTGGWQNHNVLLSSPVGSGKTILAYSCIENMFRNGESTFPLYDLLELKRIIYDMDMCNKMIYQVENPQLIFETPILFARIPKVTTQEIYGVIALLLDRRVRRGNSTIFLYSGSWKYLLSCDRTGTLEGLMGNGAYGTIEVKSYYRDDSINEELHINLPENLG